jgi:uncharacterized protein YegJ (DUF2314 family)
VGKFGLVLSVFSLFGTGFLMGCRPASDPPVASSPPSSQIFTPEAPPANPEKLASIPYTREEMPAAAPKDKSAVVKSDSKAQIKRLSQEARKSLPKIEQRFHAGLPKGQILSVTTLVHDPDGKAETVFVQIVSWKNGKIVGGVITDTGQVTSVKFGDMVAVREADVMDWTITYPDGHEEGNLVGKFSDTLAH